MTSVFQCRKCSAAMWFLKHERTGKTNPVSAEINPQGNIVVDLVKGTYQMATTADWADKSVLRYSSHFADCPNAASFRSKAPEDEPERVNDANATVSFAPLPEQQITYVHVSRIHPSDTNPRKRIDEVKLKELAASVKAKGVLEPLLVRLKTGGGGMDYEIIAGERRWRAAKIAKQETVPAIVREMDDEEVLDIQIHENLHRDDIHPLDEALGYQVLMEKIANLTVEELAHRVNKTPAYVHTRLKLNGLVEEAQEKLLSDELPVGYAMELAKYEPDAQKHILENYIWEQMYYGSDTKNLRPLAQIRESIKRHILRNLKSAPFSTTAKDLRPDGLACVDCPQRTGAVPTLFSDNGIGDADCCLNASCYNLKQTVHIEKRQAKVTKAAIKKGKPDDYAAPLVTGNYNGDAESGVLGFRSYSTVAKDKPCGHEEQAVVADEGRDLGTVKLICRDVECPTHGERQLAASELASRGAVGQTEEQIKAAASAQRMIRKEELFDYRAGEDCRRVVFGQCAAAYAQALKAADVIEENRVKEFLLPFIVRCWEGQASIDEKTSEILAEILHPHLGDQEADRISASKWGFDREGFIEVLERQDVEVLYMLMWLLTNGHVGQMVWDKYEDQSGVRAFARQWEVNYRLEDAQARLRLAERSYKKQVPQFKEYLEKVQAGDADASIPRPWSTEWNPAAREKQEQLERKLDSELSDEDIDELAEDAEAAAV